MSSPPGDHFACQELVELITEYLDDSLAADTRERFEAHLVTCRFCGTYLEQMRATIELTGHIHEDDLGTIPRAELLEAFRDWQSER
ncbi:MAG: zf-HC2 domain-containing protein [Ilumatobacteraceae bacterium]